MEDAYDPNNLEQLFAMATEAERRHREQSEKAAEQRDRILVTAYGMPGATIRSVSERFGLKPSRTGQMIRRYHKRKGAE